MNDDLSRLSAEIERLNNVISHLTKRNEQLETVVSYLIKNDGKNETGISNLPIEDGKDVFPSSYLTKEDRKPGIDYSHLNRDDGKELPDLSALFQAKAYRQSVFNLLCLQMKRCKRASVHHTVATLIHLYSHTNNSHARLKSVTQMTGSGVAKHIMMLKKRGFITRTGFQEFTLTQKSIELLKKAGEMQINGSAG